MSDPVNAKDILGEFLNGSETASLIRRLQSDLRDAVQALRDVLPYAIASVRDPRNCWPSDSVIFRAERVIARYDNENNGGEK